MKYREYRFFKKIYHINPHLNEKQKYESHFIGMIEDLGYDKCEVLAIVKSFPEYVSLINNKDGYIHCVALTPKCVSDIKHYRADLLWSILRNIIIPAIVSILCSLIVAA